jgi:hypothetical protein
LSPDLSYYRPGKNGLAVLELAIDISYHGDNDNQFD